MEQEVRLTARRRGQGDDAVQMPPEGMGAWSTSLVSPAMWIRPLWYLAILVFVAVQPIAMWQRGFVSVFAAIYVSTNILLLTENESPDWKRVVRFGLDIELWTSIVASVSIALILPQSPAPLLLLPTLTTMLVREYQSSLRTGAIVVAGLISLLLDFHIAFGLTSSKPPAQSVLTGQGTERLSSALLIGLYLVVACSMILVAVLMRHQARQTRQLQTMMGELRVKSEELMHRNVQLNEFADKVSSLAATEERNRIASEIHDTVAHRLTALFVQLQAATRQLDQGSMDTAKENLAVSEALTRESLEAVRSSVRSLRKTSANEGLSALRRLTTQYASLTGMTINTQFHEQLEGIPPVVLALLYRVIQEGLTNAKRHGRASEVKVTLLRKGLWLHLEVRDNGRGTGHAVLGFGLSTMRERVHSLGGQFTVDTKPGQGFAIQMQIPAWEAIEQ